MKILYNDGHVAECPEEEQLHVIRHTAAHIMAQAIQRLWPHADFAYGPATERGFYYDVDLGDVKITDEDLARIEAEMKKIAHCIALTAKDFEGTQAEVHATVAEICQQFPMYI